MIEKIRTRLGLKVFLGTLSSLILTFTTIFLVVSVSLPRIYERELIGEMGNLFVQLVSDLSEASTSEMSDLITSFSFNNHANVTILDEANRVIYETNFEFSNNEEEILIWSLGFSNIYDGMMYTINLEASLATVNQVTASIEKLMPYIFVLIIVVSIIISMLYSYLLVRPIIKIGEISKSMIELDFSKRCNIKNMDEIGKLAFNLNDLSESLEKALNDLRFTNAKLQEEMSRDRQREKQRSDLFTAISHELKTPITVLKGVLGGMIDKVGIYKDRDTYLLRAYKNTELMEKLVQDILMISRLETKDILLQYEKINISKLVDEVCEKHDSLASRNKVMVTYYCSEIFNGFVDKLYFQLVIANILSNAIFYSQSGSVVEVKLSKEEGQGILTVENFGSHLEEGEITQLFQPFYRGDQSRNRHTGGSGLGLYIVKNILDLHQFEYNIKNSEGGVIFTLVFSLA